MSRRWLSIPDPQRTICPKCGSTEREGEDFCICGEYLGWDDPETPSDETDGSQAPEPPEPDDRPDVASIDLRTPDREHRPGTRVRVKVEPGQSVRLHALVRNQGRLVDDWTVSVGGMPEDWWTVRPDVVNLLPEGDRGGAEQEVEIELHPPREPRAEAREWALEVVAAPVNTGATVTREPFALAIAAFSAHAGSAGRASRCARRRRSSSAATATCR